MGTSQDPAGVALSRSDAVISMAAAGPVEYAHPAHICVRAGEIQVERTCSLTNVEAFCEDIAQLHQSLKGKAALLSLEDDFRLDLEGRGRGAVHVTARVSKHIGGPYDYDLRVAFDIDQSYLPSLRSSLRAEFLNRAEP